ncbi:hypothetical protein HUT06_43255 [Actinomadura sp. NAK00032]|uniref:hypothetical protein n=1 Tax=Actinomadura sp. NAK00032 TaxID=2742128 RepID=UPI00159058B4|nr:hypothetical protein [Actinomadura sp. NAK00032]QKW40012.1 hypothetical protein HUT06_43255 [Actinomadura sp. NAK00032]
MLRPPRTLRYAARVLIACGALLVGIAIYLLMVGAIVPSMCIAFMGLVGAGRAIPLAAGRVTLDPRGLRSKDDPVGEKSLTWESINRLELRRRLWTESVVAADGLTEVTLAAPVRLRFGRDREFDAALAELSRRAGTGVVRGRSLLTLGYACTHLAILAAWTALFVTFDPVWHHSSWPGREEAVRLPNACHVIEPTAKEMFPKQAPQRLPNDDEERCRFGDSLSLKYTLFRYDLGMDGGIERAEERFREGPGGPTLDDEGARTLPGVGDGATIDTATYQDGTRVHQIQVSARKANVVAWLVYAPPEERDSRDEAVREAERLARAAVAAIAVE